MNYYSYLPVQIKVLIIGVGVCIVSNRRFLNIIAVIVSLAFIAIGFQNCGQSYEINQSEFAKLLDSGKSASSMSGNGDGYTGKLTFAHLVPGFRCENKPAPKEILFKNESNQWFLTINEREKCAIENRIPVSDVDYTGQTILRYHKKKFILVPNADSTNPSLSGEITQFKADPFANPSNPDALPGDSICADSFGKCSLLAAIQEANANPANPNGHINIVTIPSGTYLLTTTLPLASGATLYLYGENSQDTILDGQDSISILGPVSLSNHTTLVENLTFKRARATSANTGAVTIVGSMTIENCIFLQNNVLFAAIYAGVNSYDVLIEDSKFISNIGSGIFAFGSRSLIVERSEFSNNAGWGFDVMNGTNNVFIRDSTFIGNELGIQMRSCYSGCRIENTSISASNGTGLHIEDQAAVNAQDFYIVNSVIKNNALINGTNILINRPADTTKSIIIQDSTIESGGGSPNCTFFSNILVPVIISSSSIDDASCGN